MGNKYEALQGKMFFVELQSMMGSTGYSWCIKSMPEQIVCAGSENIPTRPGLPGAAPTMQRFWFAAVSAEEVNVEIEFVLARLWDFGDIADTFKAEIHIIPSNSAEYVSADGSENPVRLMYGIVYTGNGNNAGDANVARQIYGFPYDMQDANTLYGYFCGMQDANMKYGYYCRAQDVNMKYGYYCGAQDANMKYGYYCGAQDANMKYGYYCGAQDANMKYGYYCGTQDARPYGMVYTG